MYGLPTCSTNVPAIQALWGILAGLHIICLVYASYFVYIKFQAPRRKKSSLSLGAIVIIMNVCLICTGILRVSDVQTRFIGYDVPTTVLFSIAGMAFYIAVSVFTYAFVDLTIRQARLKLDVSKTLYIRMKHGLPVVVVFGVVGCALPMCMLASKSRMTTHVLASFHHLLTGANMVIMGLIVVPRVTHPLIGDIKASMSSNPSSPASSMLTVVRGKLERFDKELKSQA